MEDTKGWRKNHRLLPNSLYRLRFLGASRLWLQAWVFIPWPPFRRKAIRSPERVYVRQSVWMRSILLLPTRRSLRLRSAQSRARICMSMWHPSWRNTSRTWTAMKRSFWRWITILRQMISSLWMRHLICSQRRRGQPWNWCRRRWPVILQQRWQRQILWWRSGQIRLRSIWIRSYLATMNWWSRIFRNRKICTTRIWYYRWSCWQFLLWHLSWWLLWLSRRL